MTSGGKLEVATHKLGSIHIEDKLTEESQETPWWAKLKKKHGGTATKDKEGSTEEPVYSTFGWVEDEDVSQTLTTLRTFVDVTTLPTVKATPSTTHSTTSTTENTTKGEFFFFSHPWTYLLTAFFFHRCFQNHHQTSCLELASVAGGKVRKE